MSRVGKLPIKVPDSLKVEINGNVLKINKGEITKNYDFGDTVLVSFADGTIKVSPSPALSKKEVAKFYGMHRNNIANIIKGLIEHYKIVLEINGVGFRAVVIKNFLILTLGYSHDIVFGLPKNIVVTIDGNLIILDSEDKQLLGQIASEIISLRKPEPYKGKGVKIYGKDILRKEGKKK